jgi:uncharacterized protein (DUF1697 family)
VTYVALLRGINVGGKNIIKMDALTRCLTAARLESVRTCIQSGNVIFDSRNSSAEKLASRIERAVSDTFGMPSRVVVLSYRHLQEVLAKVPASWRRGSALRCNIAFLRPSIDAADALKQVAVNPGIDSVDIGPGVLYLSTVATQIKKSAFPRLVSTPIYRELTIRNYSTCQKIAAMMVPNN